MVRKPDEMLWRGKGGGNHAMDWYPIQGGREVIILVTSCYGKRSLQCRHLIRQVNNKKHVMVYSTSHV